jgi:cysteinyl-tRNA synthetase
LEVENKKLLQNIREIKELYEQIGMKFYRKFMAEDHYQRDLERKVSKAEEKMRQAADDLATYKNAARELEEKLERTNHYYERQIISYEQKAHFNSLEAQAAEKQLKYFRKVNSSKRQKLLKMQLEFEHLEK